MTAKRNLFYFFTLLLSISLSAMDSPPKKIIDFEAFFTQKKIEAQQVVELKIDLEVIKDHYLYLDKTKIIWPKDFPAKNTKLEFSKSEKIFDKFAKKEKEILKGKLQIRTTVELPISIDKNLESIPLGLRYQACSESYCLLPKTEFRNLEFELVGSSTPKGTSPAITEEAFSFEKALEKGWFFTFLFVFFAGILTSFTPCVFPMIPITLAVIGSRSKDTKRTKAFLLSLFYVLGIAFTYSALGLFAAQTGALFGSFMSSPIVVGIISGVLVLMALSMFGLFEIKTPQFLTNRFSATGKSTGFSGAFGAGLLAGVVASPCVGPVLVGILAFVAKTQDAMIGFWLLFTFAMGLGVLFLVLGTFSGLLQYLPKSGHWMNITKGIFGITMIGLAVYFALPVVPRYIILSIFGASTIALGTVLGFLRRAGKEKKLAREILGSISMVAGMIFFFQAGMNYQMLNNPVQEEKMSGWSAYSEQKVNDYLNTGKAVIIDFKADWCAACKELEQKTFTKDKFKELSKNFGLLYVDATEMTPEVTKTTESFGVIGLPTIIFIGKDGKVRDELTLTGFEEIEAFSQRMEKALN
jgi:thiol:disulfide interchange protein DsbD